MYVAPDDVRTRASLSALRYDVVRTREAFLNLGPEWDALYTANREENFYLRHAWFTMLLTYSPAVPDDLYVIAVRDGDELIAIFPGCLTLRRLGMFRHRTLELIGNIYSPYRGCLVKQGYERDAAQGLVDFLMAQGGEVWQALDFENLSPNDPFITELRAAFQRREVRLSAEDQFENILIDLALFTTTEAYFKSFKTSFREPIKRHINMMNREGGFDIRLPLSSAEAVEHGMEDYYAIYAASWKKMESEPDFHRHLARYLQGQGKLRLFVLYYLPPQSNQRDPAKPTPFANYKAGVMADRELPENAVPIAANFFIVEGQWAFFLKTSYREDYQRFAPGIVSMWFAFKYLFENDGVRLIDMQRGYETYKISFGGYVNEIRFQLRASHPGHPITALDLRTRLLLLPRLRKLKHWAIAMVNKSV